jgi:hypothetical protein
VHQRPRGKRRGVGVAGAAGLEPLHAGSHLGARPRHGSLQLGVVGAGQAGRPHHGEVGRVRRGEHDVGDAELGEPAPVCGRVPQGVGEQ